MKSLQPMSTFACASRCDESRAFPSVLSAQVDKAVDSIAHDELHPPSRAFTVTMDGEALHIPVRVYYDLDRLRRALNSSQGTDKHILACLGTRHHDGYFRQACLRELLVGKESWLTPYILQLVGEYIVEIVDDVARHIVTRDPAPLVAFAKENPAYMARLASRVRSYWHYYYEQAYPDLNDYPGTKVLNYLRQLDPHSLR